MGSGLARLPRKGGLPAVWLALSGNRLLLAGPLPLWWARPTCQSVRNAGRRQISILTRSDLDPVLLPSTDAAITVLYTCCPWTSGIG